jgi:hypothetical protein
MVRKYSKHRAENECIYDFGRKARRKETTKKKLDTGVRIILKRIVRK